jgi:hypothetical protein
MYLPAFILLLALVVVTLCDLWRKPAAGSTSENIARCSSVTLLIVCVVSAATSSELGTLSTLYTVIGIAVYTTAAGVGRFQAASSILQWFAVVYDASEPGSLCSAAPGVFVVAVTCILFHSTFVTYLVHNEQR